MSQLLFGIKYNTEQSVDWLTSVGYAYLLDAVVYEPAALTARAALSGAFYFSGAAATAVTSRWSHFWYGASNCLPC